MAPKGGSGVREKYDLIDWVKYIEQQAPVLVINSKIDTMTPYFMGKDIYDAISENNKEIWTVDYSEHCGIWLDYDQEYRNKVDGFLKKYE